MPAPNNHESTCAISPESPTRPRDSLQRLVRDPVPEEPARLARQLESSIADAAMGSRRRTSRFRFGDFEADGDRFVLLRRGNSVPIEPKPLQLLLHLLARHPRTVTKDELLDALWADTSVTQGSLTRAIREVRRALRQRAAETGVIRTIRGVGYGIDVEVECVGAATGQEPGQRFDVDGECLDATESVNDAPPVADQPPVERRHAAILSADAAGYRRRLTADAATAEAELRQSLRGMTAAVEAAGGRVVDTAVDNLLAEFPTALAATRTALAIQQAAADAGGSVREGQRFRIGLHVGDIIADDRRIYGDTVDVAARLESLAPVGGMAASAAVVESVQVELGLGWSDPQETRLKTVAQPVRFYAYAPDGPGDPAASGLPMRELAPRSQTWGSSDRCRGLGGLAEPGFPHRRAS